MSLDFRSVHLDDLAARPGAPNIDNASRGTTIRDYLQGRDLTRVPEDVRSLYEQREPRPEELSPGALGAPAR